MKFDKLFDKSKEKKNLDNREQKRQMALASGNEYTYLACPLCCLNRIMSKTGIKAQKKGKIEQRVSFSKFDLNDAFFIQIRKSLGGKGAGFWLDESQSLTMEQAIMSGEYDDLIEDVKKQCQRVIDKINKLKKTL